MLIFNYLDTIFFRSFNFFIDLYCAGNHNNRSGHQITLKQLLMRKADLVNQISEKTGIPKVDVLITLETMFREIKESLGKGENIYIRGFGSFITKKRAAKIGRNIKRNTAVHIPEHYIPAFKPSKEFVQEIKEQRSASVDQ
jgi:DNA-binding protein HU-beta